MKKINLILFFILIMLIWWIVSADLQVYRNIKNTIGYMSKMIFTVDGTLWTPVKVSIDGLTGNISLSWDLRIWKNICLWWVCNSSFDSLWSLNWSNVSYNGWNVWIWTSTPSAKLYVKSDWTSSLDSILTLQRVNWVSLSYYQKAANGQSNNNVLSGDQSLIFSNDSSSTTYTNGLLIWGWTDKWWLKIMENWNIWVWSTIPWYKLDINDDWTTAMIRIHQADSTRRYEWIRLDRTWNAEKWFIWMDDTSDNFLLRRAWITNDIVIWTTGNMWIWAVPSYKLHVVWDTYITWGRLKVAGTKWLYFNDYTAWIYMQDASWIRTTWNQSIWTNNWLLWTNGWLSVWYNGVIWATANGWASIAWNVWIWISSPAYKLDVVWLINTSSWICMNGDCKTAWAQVWWWWTVNYTWTCDSAHKWYTWILSGYLKFCNGSSWINIVSAVQNYFAGSWTPADPYRLYWESAIATTVWAASCNYYNLNSDTLNSWVARWTWTCWWGTKACLTDAVYMIDPDWAGWNSAYSVYCDMTTDWWWRNIIGINWDLTSNACEVSLKWVAACGSLWMATDRRPANFPSWSKFMIVVYNTNIFTERKMYDKVALSSYITTVSTSVSWNFESSNITTEYGRFTSSHQANPIYLAQTTNCATMDLLRICYSGLATCYSTHETGTYWFDDYQDGCWLWDSWGSTTYRWYRSYIMVK